MLKGCHPAALRSSHCYSGRIKCSEGVFCKEKKICSEVDAGLSDQQLSDILEAATNNGNEITFKEFQEYMSMVTK